VASKTAVNLRAKISDTIEVVTQYPMFCHPLSCFPAIESKTTVELSERVKVAVIFIGLFYFYNCFAKFWW